MVDEISVFFESRETRTSRLPEPVRAKFAQVEQSALAAGDTEFADKQFVSLWLSRRTGVPRDQIIANFEGITSRFFGEGATAASAWDEIAKGYQPVGGGDKSPETQRNGPGGAPEAEAEWAETEGLPRIGPTGLMENVGQSARAAGGGFEGFSQKSMAGLYSQMSAFTGFQPKLPGFDSEYSKLAMENQQMRNPARFAAEVYGGAGSSFVLGEAFLGIKRKDGPVDDATAEKIAANEARMAEIAQRVDGENREALKAFIGSTRDEISQEYRKVADFWLELSEGAMERWGVTPEFQETTFGQFMASAGSVPATAAMAALGPGGLLLMESAFFSEVEEDRKRVEGAAYDPQAALTGNLATALPQVALERMFGVERALNIALKAVPKHGGRVAFGDFARLFVKRGMASGVEEGLTEPAQGFWQDFQASLSYDDKRELLSADAVKLRMIEAVSGFALGFVFGGGITAAQSIDQNRAAKPVREYLTAKDGQPLTLADFRALRSVKSDKDILAAAPDPYTGRILLAAVNGDETAQKTYNSRMMDSMFVDTEGVDVDGRSLGMVNSAPVVRMKDGMVMPLDLTDPGHREYMDNFKQEAIRVQSLNEMAEFQRKGIEAGREIEVSEDQRTMNDFIKEGRIEVEEAAKRIGIAADVNAAPVKGVNPEDARVLGSNVAEYRDGVFRDVSTVYAGGNAFTVVEEVAEGYVKKRVAVGDLVDADLTAWRQRYEKDTGTKTESTGAVSNIEWFSKRAVDYAVANRKLPDLPKSWGAFLRTLGEHLKTVVRLSERLKKLLRSGKVDADFEQALKEAVGMAPVKEAKADDGQAAIVEDVDGQQELTFSIDPSELPPRPVKPNTMGLEGEERQRVLDQWQEDMNRWAKEVAEIRERAMDESFTFELTGMPQNRRQVMNAQEARIRAKSLVAMGELIARIQAGAPLPQKVKAMRAQAQAGWASRNLVPISTRLRNLSAPIAQRMRRFEFDLGQAMKRDVEAATPFLIGLSSMSKGDSAILDLALKNGNVEVRDQILSQYNLTKQFAAVQAMIDGTRKRAEAAGYDITQVPDYYPRKVNDLDGLMMHFYGKPQAGKIEKALRDASRKAIEQGRVLTNDEKHVIVNNVLRGYRPPEFRPRHVKVRTVEVIDIHANRFYADSAEALISYIETMNESIEKRRFFGKFAIPTPGVGGGVSNTIALDTSIGAYVEDLIEGKQITRLQQEELQAILRARFQTQASSAFIRHFKSIGYMTTMGQVTSALTQLGDLAFSMYENGVYRTIVAAGKATVGRSDITRETLGLNSIAEEFKDRGKMNKALNRVFKITGLHYIDSVGKETLVSAKFRTMQREVRRGRLSPRTTQIIQDSFDPETSEQVIKDLRDGKKTPDTLFAVFSVLADYQPITLSEYPEGYLANPNGRVLYMLKSFTIKQLDAFRREAFSLMVHGNAKQKAVGFRNLIHLAGLFYLINVPVDWLKDWIMGRDPQLSDIAIDNIWKLMGVNRYAVWRAREQGLVEAAAIFLAPPAPFIEHPLRDIWNATERIAEGEDIKPGEFESWRIIPFVGSPIYWRGGGGAEKVKKRREKREKKNRRTRVRN